MITGAKSAGKGLRSFSLSDSVPVKRSEDFFFLLLDSLGRYAQTAIGPDFRRGQERCMRHPSSGVRRHLFLCALTRFTKSL